MYLSYRYILLNLKVFSIKYFYNIYTVIIMYKFQYDNNIYKVKQYIIYNNIHL